MPDSLSIYPDSQTPADNPAFPQALRFLPLVWWFFPQQLRCVRWDPILLYLNLPLVHPAESARALTHGTVRFRSFDLSEIFLLSLPLKPAPLSAAVVLQKQLCPLAFRMRSAVEACRLIYIL